MCVTLQVAATLISQSG
ncbi:hypothetical protein Q4I28_004413 [Leishmania naiffi]|uniref:Uncharacterized protein n=1 Tax=Leishmania naiffi TaxID=5678 RepID=A0AAW3BPF6_9TRYP